MTPEERFERHEQFLEQHDRMMAEHDRTMAEHARHMAEHDRLLAEHVGHMAELDRQMAKHQVVMDRIDARLDRAVRLSMREARSERIKRRELDENITQLAAAQLVTEEKLQGLIEAWKRRGNGNT